MHELQSSQKGDIVYDSFIFLLFPIITIMELSCRSDANHGDQTSNYKAYETDLKPVLDYQREIV